MKKFSIFITILLIILIASMVFVLQNNSTIVSLKFFGWTFPTVSVGLLTIVMFFAGFIVMWLISLMLYFGSLSNYRKEIKSRDKLIKQLEEEKNSMKADLENTKKALIEKDAEIKKLREKLNASKEKPAKTVQKESPESKKEEQQKEQTKQEENPKRRGIFRRR